MLAEKSQKPDNKKTFWGLLCLFVQCRISILYAS